MPPRPDDASEPLSIRIVALADVSSHDVERWKALADRSVEPNVYLDPRFLVPARDRPDAAGIRLMFIEHDDELRGVFQFSTGRLEDRWPIAIATTGGSFMSIHSDRHHPLVAREDVNRTVRELVRGLGAPGLPGLTLLRYLPMDGPLADAFASAFDELGYRWLERSVRSSAYVGHGYESPDPQSLFDFSHVSSSRAKAYRRRARGIERDAGDAPLALVDRRDDPAVIEDFLDFQAAGWKGDPSRGGGAFRLDPVHESWYRQVVAGFAQDGDLLAPVLVAGDQVVFMALDFRSGGAAFGFIDAYNERFASQGAGTLGRLAELQYIATKTDATHFDPAFDPRYSDSTKLYPDRRGYVDVLVGRSLRARAVLALLPLAKRIRERLKRS